MQIFRTSQNSKIDFIPKKFNREREREKMLWVDKHRPKSLKALDYHKNLAQRLMGLVGSSFFILLKNS